MAMEKRLYFNFIDVLTSAKPRQVRTKIGKTTDWIKCSIIELVVDYTDQQKRCQSMRSQLLYRRL